MDLGIIGWINEEDFRIAQERGLKFIELDINEKDKEFFEKLEQIKTLSQKYQLPIGAIGRWGTNRISKEGIVEDEFQLECRILDAAKELHCPVYITGCNYIDELSFYENCTLAISYLEKLINYGKEANIKIATYNCRWNNFIYSEKAWTIIHGQLKNLYIKYDTSHCIYAGGNYLKEARDWGDRFAHVHIKGALVIDGERYDDPPAGLDQTDWQSFMALLYIKGYKGNLSIEPHSEHWRGELGEKGIDYTIKYIKQLLL